MAGLNPRYDLGRGHLRRIYILVAVIITIIGLITLFGSGPGGGPLPGLIIIVIGNLIWRIYMEFVMLFFRINDGIQKSPWT